MAEPNDPNLTPPEPTPQPTGKVWTQEEHDAYVKGRIDKQAAKNAEVLAAKDARIHELEEAAKEAEARIKGYEDAAAKESMLKKVSEETGVPASLLRGNTEEELMEHANAIKATFPGMPTAPNPAAVVPPQAPPIDKDAIWNIKDDKRRYEAIRRSYGIE